jgi:transcription factor SPT20
VDFLELFDSARVPFYDGLFTRRIYSLFQLTLSEIGCMVVELLDYRPQRSKEPALKVPEKTRVVLHPNSETLWADICLMNRRNGSQWTDKDALEVEAKILVNTPAFILEI